MPTGALGQGVWHEKKKIRKCTSFAFTKNYLFNEENNLSGKVVIVEEELYCIGNLVDLPALIDGECGNLKVVVGGRESTRNINRKKKSEVLQPYRFPLCIGEIEVSLLNGMKMSLYFVCPFLLFYLERTLRIDKSNFRCCHGNFCESAFLKVTWS